MAASSAFPPTDLAREYDGATCEEVDSTVRAGYERFCRESLVTDFVPILTERRSRARLSLRWGGRRAAGVAPGRLAALQVT